MHAEPIDTWCFFKRIEFQFPSIAGYAQDSLFALNPMHALKAGVGDNIPRFLFRERRAPAPHFPVMDHSARHRLSERLSARSRAHPAE